MSVFIERLFNVKITVVVVDYGWDGMETASRIRFIEGGVTA